MLYNCEHEVTIMPDDVKQTRKYQRKTPRITPVAFYLGDSPARERRADMLTEIAHQLGLRNRSELIQKIADGEYHVTPKEQQP